MVYRSPFVGNGARRGHRRTVAEAMGHAGDHVQPVEGRDAADPVHLCGHTAPTTATRPICLYPLKPTHTSGNPLVASNPVVVVDGALRRNQHVGEAVVREQLAAPVAEGAEIRVVRVDVGEHRLQCDTEVERAIELRVAQILPAIGAVARGGKSMFSS
jgi:hypothetical protein